MPRPVRSRSASRPDQLAVGERARQRLPDATVPVERDHLDPVALPLPHEQLEQPFGPEVLGHRHHPQAPIGHRPRARVPVPEVRQHRDDPVPLFLEPQQVLVAVPREGVEHVGGVPLLDRERVEPIAGVAAERLARVRPHERIVHRPAEHARLVPRDRHAQSRCEPKDDRPRSLEDRATHPRRQPLRDPRCGRVREVGDAFASGFRRFLDRLGRRVGLHALASRATCPVRTAAASPERPRRPTPSPGASRTARPADTAP